MDSDQFHDLLHELTALDPGNLLLNKFRREGCTVVNALLIEKQVEKARQSNPTGQFGDESPLEGGWGGEDDADPIHDDTLRSMRVKLRKLFSDRNRLSDRFFGLKTVKDRAFNSEEIQLVQRNIERLMQAIRHYKIHGELPAEAMRHYIPKDGLELSKKQNSLRANISREKKIIAELREQLDNHPNDPALARKLEKRLDRMEILKTDLKNVTEAIDHLQQSGVQEGE